MSAVKHSVKKRTKNVNVISVCRRKNPTFRAPRTHKETASFALKSACDFADRSSVNAVSCNALHIKADLVNCHYMHFLQNYCGGII